MSAARAAGAQFVIAVDVSAHGGTAPFYIPESWLEHDARRRARIEAQVAQADFLIHPDFGYLAPPTRAYVDSVKSQGEATARQRMHALMAKLRSLFGSIPSIERATLRTAVPDGRRND